MLIAEFSMADIAQALGATWHGTSDVRLAGVTTDSRNVPSGALFVALVGPRFDGHNYIKSALDAGASAVMVSTLPEEQGPWLLVEDTLDALQRLGRFVWEQANARGVQTIALTGSNGKTTTKEILRALWQARGATYATHGNYNNHIGVPLTLTNMPAGLDTLIVEMGANAPGDIRELIAMAPGTLRIVTSIGVAHIEGFGGLEGVRRTKGEIFEGADASCVAIVPHEERDALLPHDFPGTVWTFGQSADADLQVALPESDTADVLVDVTHDGETLRVRSPLHGEHNASNLTAALGTILARDNAPDAQALSTSLEALSLPQGRWREVHGGGHVFLDDAYNANPSSVLASFGAFMTWRRNVPQGEGCVAVLGEMLELGKDAKSWHERVARSICEEEDLTTFIAVGLYAHEMTEAARGVGAPGLQTIAANTVEEAALALQALAPSVVFLKASRGARLERVIDLVQDGRASAP